LGSGIILVFIIANDESRLGVGLLVFDMFIGERVRRSHSVGS
jgi:hypothetical protein